MTNESEYLNYLSLKTASQLYGYTRDHLGLMIRQDKLKGQKLGSYYVTTKEWMIEYINNFADPNHPKLKNKLSNKFLVEAIESGKKITPTLPSKNNGQLEKFPLQNKLMQNLQKELITLMPASQDINNQKISNQKTSENKEVSAKNYNFRVEESPYVILPIRKMEEIERNRILNRINGADSNTESV